MKAFARSTCSVFLFFCLCCGPVKSYGIGFNMDFGAESGGVAPDSTYAAMGSAGYWNLITEQTGSGPHEFELRDLDEETSSVGMTVYGGLYDHDGISAGSGVGSWRLMGDFLTSFGSIVIHGLPEGSYLFTAYALGEPGEPFPTTVQLQSATSADIVLTGYWDPEFKEGVNYGSTFIQVDSGGLQIISNGKPPYGSSDPFFNGLQIISVPEPTAGLISIAGGFLFAVKRKPRFTARSASGRWRLRS